MAERVSQSTRAILNTIAQLQTLERTLRGKVRGESAAESIRIRSVIIDTTKLIAQLEGIAAKTSAKSGSNIEQVKEKLAAEASKRRSGQLKAKDECDPIEKADGADLAGVMVALLPSKGLAAELVVEDGEPQENLHVTLIYLKDKAADREDWDRLSEVVEKTVAKHTRLSGYIAGAGRFVNDDGDVAWASLDLPGLVALRQDLLEAAEKAGFEVHKDHDWTPHMTLKYLDKGEAFPKAIEKIPARFGKVHVVTGDKKYSSHALGTK